MGSTTTLYSHDATSNRLKSSSGGEAATYTYDAAGNRANDNGWTQTYNNAGRLIQSVKGSTTITYSYNALGQRVKKSSPSGTTIFVYDTEGHLLGEYGADGTLVQETVWLGETPVAVVKPTADPLKPSISYIWADHLATPRQISEPASKQILWRWDGEPFGADLANENPSGKGQYTYNLRFPGQYFDKETGKHYNYFRDYDPSTGRYVQSDPIGLDGGINTYAYVEGNPVGDSNPLGLMKAGGRQAGSPSSSSLPPPSAPKLGCGRFDDWDPSYGVDASGCINAGGLKICFGPGSIEGAGPKLIAGMGGRFANLKGTVGDELTAHHIPQAALNWTSRSDGGAIVMTSTEHAATRTYGYNGVLTKAGDSASTFRDVLAKDIRDVRSIAGSKYNEGLQNVIKYYEANFPNLIRK